MREVIDAWPEPLQAPPRMLASAALLARLRRPRGGGVGRAWLGLMLALALALKLLVPQGWMPGPSALILCPSAGSAPVMAGMHHGTGKAGEKAPAHLADHPCAFAGLGLAATPPAPIVAVMPHRPAPAGLAQPAFAVAIGPGLAAPPPPTTGPPAFA